MHQPTSGRFGRLVEYLMDPKGKRQRVGKIQATHCYSDDPVEAALEVMNTQALNVRALSDKSYHLVVSFRTGEEPPDETLAAIEQSLVDGLGFSEHQRVSVVHHDTDNLHIHIVINKIHPHRYTIHEPIRDYLTLATLCTQLEKIHGLKTDNHRTQAQRLPARAAEMETRGQTETLVGWIRRECAATLAAASNWQEWHRMLADNGLSSYRRANGLVIESDAGVRVKASTIDRRFSYASLTERFGPFEADPTAGPTPRRRRYEPQPLQSGSAALYARYQRERLFHIEKRRLHHRRLAAAQRTAIDSAFECHAVRRRALRALPYGLGKRLLYQQLSGFHRQRLDAIRAQARETRRLIEQTHSSRAWSDWLVAEAAHGNFEALHTLRTRQPVSASQNSLVLSAGVILPQGGLSTLRSIPTKRGTVPLGFGIRDHGNRLSIAARQDARGYVALLTTAIHRFGPRLNAHGDERFRTQLVVAAVVTGAAVTFEDQALEDRRQTLVTLLETMNERNNTDRRTTNRGGACATAERSHCGPGFTPQAIHPGLRRRAPGSRADLGGPAGRPAAATLDGMRNLSASIVAGHGAGPEMLLPGDVHDQLGQRSAAVTDSLRRTLPPQSVTTLRPTGWFHADHYIAERMEKSLLLSDIPKHERHEKPGVFPFAGLRTVNGQSLALFKKDGGIGVMPISEYAARRLKSLPLDKPVEVTRKGIRVGRTR